LDHHHGVLYAIGAPVDRGLDIGGIGMPGTGSATDMVAWINGHPKFAGAAVELDDQRAVIIGNGNVALDVARILTADPESLARTDISDLALDALRNSGIREVVIAARRDPVNSAFTLPELIGLTSKVDVVLDAADRALVDRDLERVSDPVTAAKLEILAQLPDSQAPVSGPRIRLAYRLTPHRIVGTDRIRGIEFIRTGTTATTVLDAGLLLTSTGYRGAPVPGLPFDDAAAVLGQAQGTPELLRYDSAEGVVDGGQPATLPVRGAAQPSCTLPTRAGAPTAQDTALRARPGPCYHNSLSGSHVGWRLVLVLSIRAGLSSKCKRNYTDVTSEDEGRRLTDGVYIRCAIQKYDRRVVGYLLLCLSMLCRTSIVRVLHFGGLHCELGIDRSRAPPRWSCTVC
jgi:hypothetical protein